MEWDSDPPSTVHIIYVKWCRKDDKLLKAGPAAAKSCTRCDEQLFHQLHLLDKVAVIDNIKTAFYNPIQSCGKKRSSRGSQNWQACGCWINSSAENPWGFAAWHMGVLAKGQTNFQDCYQSRLNYLKPPKKGNFPTAHISWALRPWKSLSSLINSLEGAFLVYLTMSTKHSSLTIIGSLNTNSNSLPHDVSLQFSDICTPCQHHCVQPRLSLRMRRMNA